MKASSELVGVLARKAKGRVSAGLVGVQLPGPGWMRNVLMSRWFMSGVSAGLVGVQLSGLSWMRNVLMS